MQRSLKNGAWMITGIGDLINTMITAAIAVLFILLIQHRVGSMALIVFPTVVGGISGAIGVLILPYTKMITTAIGNMVNGLQITTDCHGIFDFNGI